MSETCCWSWKGWLSANRASLAPAQLSTSPPRLSCLSHSSSPTRRLSTQASVFSVTCTNSTLGSCNRHHKTWNFISFPNKNTSDHKGSSRPPAEGAWPSPNQPPTSCSLGGETLTSSQESMRASASASKEAWLQSASFLSSDWSCLLTPLISSTVSPRPASPSLTSHT